MGADNCIMVDAKDNIIGVSSKDVAHRRTKDGETLLESFRLHRAFSVFLFDERNRLLLQQRAHSKITFPLVWTNTCCSHPLHGQDPPEVDGPEDVASGAVPGVKRAAIRKLEHELGIRPGKLHANSLKFCTRLHYCAADSTEPEPDLWGEHELDYILLAKADVDLKPNPEEVEAVRYVDPEELAEMMDASSGISWSPWFRILAERFLPTWWANLETALHSDEFLDGQIHHLGL